MKARCLCGATRFEVQLRNHEVLPVIVPCAAARQVDH